MSCNLIFTVYQAPVEHHHVSSPVYSAPAPQYHAPQYQAPQYHAPQYSGNLPKYTDEKKSFKFALFS